MLKETVLVLASLVVIATATHVNYCGVERAYEDPTQVQITACDKPPCRLRKKTVITVQQKFVPERDIQNLKTSVNAVIVGVPLPFIGVDGTDACSKIYDATGAKVGCPLKKGTEYIYRDQFPILEFYPKVNLVVHYGLKEGNRDVTCFEVPSKITN